MDSAQGYPSVSAFSIPADPPKLLDRIRGKAYSIRTGKSYAYWIKRFILFRDKL
jgi:hypothetical protein